MLDWLQGLGQEGGDLWQMDAVKWTVISTLVIPRAGTYEPRDLAWDTKGNHFWISYQTPAKIKKQSAQNGSVLGEFVPPNSPQQGCAWDGWFLWATGGSTPKTINQIDVNPPFVVLKGALQANTPIQFELTGATNEVGNVFVVGWSGTGATGFKVGSKIVPLTFDAFTVLGLQLLPYFSTVVGPGGSATTPQFQWPPVPSGLPFWTCGVTLDSGGLVSINGPVKYVTQ